MQVTRHTIPAECFAYSIANVIAPPLRKSDCSRLPIVHLWRAEWWIVDGYHRIAGMIAAGETEIDCLSCDDADLIGDAGNPERPQRQAEALARIYAAV